MTDGCTGPANSGDESAAQPPQSREHPHEGPPGAAEERRATRIVSSIPANQGSATPPRSGRRIASSTPVPVAETSVTPSVASG